MLTAADLVAAVRAAQRIPSNAALARVLGVPERTVARWHTGRNTPDDETAAKLAELAGLDVGEVLASMAAARAASGPARELWQRIAQRLHAASAAALAVILSLWIGGGPDGSAMASTPVASNGAQLSITQFTRYTLARVLMMLVTIAGRRDRRCSPRPVPQFSAMACA